MTETVQFNSMEDIERHKAALRGKIDEKDREIHRLWNELFHEKKPTADTPSARMTKILSLGTGVFDGAMLGWKLYRRFKKK